MKDTKENTDILKKLGFVHRGDGDWSHKRTGWGIFIDQIESFPWLIERLIEYGNEEGYESAIEDIDNHLIKIKEKHNI